MYRRYSSEGDPLLSVWRLDIFEYLRTREPRMTTRNLKKLIRANAEEIRRLQSRVTATAKHRDGSPEARIEWKRAAAEFRSRYDGLAFPGGYDGALERISSGDPNSIEAAICFLECRPYFFRSGYMFPRILRRCQRASLSKRQAARLQAVVDGIAEWSVRKILR